MDLGKMRVSGDMETVRRELWNGREAALEAGMRG